MKKRTKAALIILLGIMFVFKNYVVVIGQVNPVLVALNKADATLAIIDPAGMKVTAKVPTGEGPHEVILSTDGRTAYVANYGNQTPGNSFSIIDLATAKELRRVDLGPLLRPHGIQLLGGKIYFTAEVNRAIGRFDPVGNKVDWIMGTGQNGSHMVVGTADQRRFYTANIGSDSVTMFELQAVPPSGSKIVQIPVGRQPEAIDLSPDGKEVWIGLNAEGSVEIVDTANARSVQKIDTGGRPYRVKFVPDGQRVVCTLPMTKELVIIDVSTRKITKRIKLENAPLGIVFSADGKTAFISAVEPDAVLKVNLDTGEVTGRVETGKVPDGIAVAGV